MNQTTTDQLTALIAVYGVVFSIIGLVSIIFAVIVWWRIFSKAGFNGALSLLMFVPIANLVMILILAFAKWPIYAELNQLRMMRGQQFPPNQPYPQNLQYPQTPQNPQYR